MKIKIGGISLTGDLDGLEDENMLKYNISLNYWEPVSVNEILNKIIIDNEGKIVFENDATLTTGTYWYRIKSVKNGVSSFYSDVLEVML